jgi:hypothetical protein
MIVKCNKCGYVGDETEFPKGRDFFQNPYISKCPKDCGNRQSPGDASMRMFGGTRPFEYVRDSIPKTIIEKVIHNADKVVSCDKYEAPKQEGTA